MTIPPLLLQPRPSLCSSHLHLPGLLPNQLQEEELLFFYIFFFSGWFFEVKHSYLIRLLGVYHKLVTCNKLAHLLAPTRSKANKVACGLILPCLG